ncbi:MAG: hypothetical protein AVDCRST_MAG21-744 [uncultured Nocardioidaceae bacterium]|uniref:Uncharacterized protein n=1 Tax=uncultured Nocardioidaceae bacterium TaxID=253824 RepID=A0A6J4MW70_9ACTN|nr:MAG: hypothetical protein AVDCRST_MAG21-744 [uncultured Nocardioidaceae bacterium]
MSALPRSARLACWFNAWTSGAVSLDEAPAAVMCDDAAHDVLGLASEPMPLLLAFGELRKRGGRLASVALPVPGDLVGLGGPAPFNVDALDVGEAVIVWGAGVGLLPEVVGRGVFWTCVPADPPRALLDLADAEQLLRHALLRAGDRLVTLDVARWRPEVAEALSTLRGAPEVPLPAGHSPRAARVTALAQRCLTMAQLALDDDGASVSLTQSRARRDVLVELDSAARQALAAACSFGVDAHQRAR